MRNLLMVHCLALGLTFGIQASESGSTGTLVSRTETRTISTTETRNPNPDGSLSGTFSQLIKGTKDQEKIQIKGSIQKVDDKETFTLDEQGKNALGQPLDNSVTITRDLVGGVLTEKLVRKSKGKTGKKDDVPELGGLPAFVISQDNSDGSKSIKVFNSPNSDPNKDIPDLNFRIPVDTPTILSLPPLDVFVNVTFPTGNVTGGTGGTGAPPATPPTIPPPVGTNPDSSIPAAAPPVVPPPVVPPPPPVEEPPPPPPKVIVRSEG